MESKNVFKKFRSKKFKKRKNPLIAIPATTRLDPIHFSDFVLIASESLFSFLQLGEIETIFKETTELHKENENSEISEKERFAKCLDDCVNNLILLAFTRGANVKISVVIIALKNFLEKKADFDIKKEFRSHYDLTEFEEKIGYFKEEIKNM